jgi:Nucleotide modification associated domain 5
MRLTNTLREAFVRAAMDDVPYIDYDEQIRSLVNTKVADMYSFHGLSKIAPDRLKNSYFYLNGQSFSVNGLYGEETKAIKELADIAALIALATEQDNKRTTLQINIKGAINACNTRKQAVAALPEFEKYLPADEGASLRSLPVIANVFSDFVKAGWPKDQKRITI